MKLSGRIVFSSGIGSDFDIWVLNLNTSSLQQMTVGAHLNDHPRWSPDGKSIVWVSTRDDMIPSLWIMDHEGGTQTRLTTDVYCASPCFSHDGREIIFVSNDGNANDLDICAYDIHSGTTRMVCSHPGIQSSPSVSPDGTKILFSTPGETETGQACSRDTNIVAYDLRLQTLTILAQHPAKEYGAVYSHQGDRIAFVSHRNQRSEAEYLQVYHDYRDAVINGSNAEARRAMVRMRSFEDDGDIFVMNADGSDIKQLTHDSRSDRGICWSPCGNFILYTSAPRNESDSERFRLIDSRSGKSILFDYDRAAFEREIGADALLNRTFLQRITPDFWERLFLDGALLGEERHPHWINF
jgi:TolB protein